ncbi:Uncharacterised protein [Mycobacterium tuberculosis]|uniref:Uncharacterized protein n=1 Tax=Mycobacterium tuberculosis TaxID=1773 RepID=A0A0U0SJQ0_MYCTX|nr:Uncharacterised protein [Mycobacterium tuberculosis]COW10389.1 Uncharacterised protein [Mycobacterium tuberculosis]COW35698.1 Uncharacterised protein [Mycobacterium tuberculosis]COW81737.1 Uncharacterised protein [Mycobacterium tuberculosis]COW82063.1 Uncharacterised protein [Mycobacterium tuberculosis]
MAAIGRLPSAMTAIAPSFAHASTDRYVSGPLSEMTSTLEPRLTDWARKSAARPPTSATSSRYRSALVPSQRRKAIASGCCRACSKTRSSTVDGN